MPGRTIQPANVGDPAGLRSVLTAMQGMFDDPVGYVRVKWGAYDAGSFSRTLTLQVVDRLDKPYPPGSFMGYRRRPGTASGRWLVGWYLAETEFGTPLSAGGTYTAGKQFTDLSGFILSETDSSGKIVITGVSKAGTNTWCHAGVLGLLRSRGIAWTTAAADGDDGGAASGDIVTSS